MKKKHFHIVLPCLFVCLPGVTDGLKLCSECSLQLFFINVYMVLFLFDNVIYVFLLL